MKEVMTNKKTIINKQIMTIIAPVNDNQFLDEGGSLNFT
jgi:hypothetical protein